MAIIAYKQPITKAQIEQIRGVNCDYAIQKLLEKELVEIQGKSDGVGRPILYGTSNKFLEYFGINDLKDLPSPKDFATEVNEIGEVNDPEYNTLAQQAVDEIFPTSENESPSSEETPPEASNPDTKDE
jgi:segregation and condensation protein B